MTTENVVNSICLIVVAVGIHSPLPVFYVTRTQRSVVTMILVFASTRGRRAHCC